MKLIIIRHAEPDDGTNGLTEKGFEEAEALGAYFKDIHIDYIYNSPLKRAKKTCEAILKYHPQLISTQCDYLVEFDHQVVLPNVQKQNLTGDIYPSFYTQEKDFYDKDKYLSLPYFKDYGIDKKYQHVIENFDKMLLSHGYKRNNLMYDVEKESTDTIVIVCHFGQMCVLLSHLLNIPYVVLANTFVCPPSGVTTLITEEREKSKAIFRLNGFGDISHLRIKHLEPSFHARFCETYSSKDRH